MYLKRSLKHSLSKNCTLIFVEVRFRLESRKNFEFKFHSVDTEVFLVSMINYWIISEAADLQFINL